MIKSKLLLMSSLMALSLCISSCGGNEQNDSQNEQISQSEIVNSEISNSVSEEVKLNFTGITMGNKTVTYNGQEHTITVEGVPEFAQVTYSNDGPYTNVGEYTIGAKVSADGYNDLDLSAKLNIVKADLEGLTFSDVKYEYDGNVKTIYVDGNIPSDATITYTSDVAGVTNSASEVGVYNITAVIKAPNFNDVTLNAKLTINAVDDERFLKTAGNALFFQNAIDDNKLYAYHFGVSKIMKVNNDNAVDMEEYGQNSIMYVSKSLLNSSVKIANYDITTNKVSSQSLINKHARYIQIESENVIYYVINGFTNEKSGIYKVDFSGQEPVETCLSVGKAKYLQLNDGKLYFADGANGDKLSSISTSQTNQTRTLVVDEKINNLKINNGELYFTVNNILGDYIAKYSISENKFRKLTSDAGIDFTFIGNDVYYVNVDLFSSTVVGKGIYKVSTNPLVDNNLPGTQVIDGGELGVCSLTNYSKSLIYYDVNGYKLMKYSTVTQESENLLAGFVKPEDPAPTSFGSQVETANGVIYYLDIYDGKTLHSYNPKTKTNFRLTSEKVDNFSIIGDYIYYNMVSFGINNDTYRMNIKAGGAPELVNTYDSKEVVSDGTYIYYVERNATGVSTAIHKADMDGQNDVIIFNYAADNLVLDNNTLYFCAKPTAVQTIMKISNVSQVTTQQAKVCVNDDYACDVFDISNGVIYFRQNYGLAYKFHRLAKMNVDGTGYVAIVEEDTDPTEIIVSDGYVYYTNSADTANDFDLYKISINGTDGQQKELTTNKYASSICLCENEVYFINYYLGGTLGDSYLYSVSINGGETIQITK